MKENQGELKMVRAIYMFSFLLNHISPHPFVLPTHSSQFPLAISQFIPVVGMLRQVLDIFSIGGGRRGEMSEEKNIFKGGKVFWVNQTDTRWLRRFSISTDNWNCSPPWQQPPSSSKDSFPAGGKFLTRHEK